MIVDPGSMDVITWTSQVTPLMDKYGPVGVLVDPKEWQSWAANVVLLLGISRGSDVPSPYYFDDWRVWADRFCQVTDNIL